MNSAQKVYAQKRIVEIAKQKINTAIKEINELYRNPTIRYEEQRLIRFKNKDFTINENADSVCTGYIIFNGLIKPGQINYAEINKKVDKVTAEINREANIVRDTIMLGGETEALSALQSFQDKDFSNLYG